MHKKMVHFSLLLVTLLAWPSELHATCPTGWMSYKNNCYMKFDRPKRSWDAAKFACERENAELAEVKDQEENDFIKDNLGGGAWLGISRCHSSSTCGLKFTSIHYTNWAAGQPDNRPQRPPGFQNKDFAAFIQENGMWVDNLKQDNNDFICKRPDNLCAINNGGCNRAGSECKDGKCICKPGFSGPYCYVEPCDNEPCKNGGSCDVVDADYKCTCINNYSGKNCTILPPCEDKKPCENGARCEDLSSLDYKCHCLTGWLGKNCSERPCDREPCVNARRCVNKGDDYDCICLPRWTGKNCETDGNARGDPHYYTFDNKHYEFMGKCEYVYAKDCSEDHAFEILQQNEVCGWNGRVDCTKSLRVFFGKVDEFEVLLERNGIVYVNGERVTLPWERSGATIKTYGSGATLSVPDLLFSVLWDGRMRVDVKINQRYQGKMCGLMGNADGDPNNDFQLPNKTITKDVSVFANSWKKNPKCVDGTNPPDPCDLLNPNELKSVKQKCSQLKRGPFQTCNEKITPDLGFIPDCEYDMCAMNTNPSAALCQALDSYSEACKAAEININWEGQAGFEECGNPCANMPCFNGAECKNINRKDYTCTCPKSFSGPTCANAVCRSGYLSRGNNCYKKMTRRPWEIAKCRGDDKFAVPENEDENKFIYENFVQRSRKTFWLNSRVCDEDKLCTSDYGVVFYHNFAGAISANGCVEMSAGGGGKWSSRQNCNIPYFYVCKYEVF